MINVKRITKNYGALTVLSDVSFSLNVAEKVALVGPNGVGKTTLLKIIAGLEEPDSGEVQIAKNACIGYLPQEIKVPESETVESYFRKMVGLEEIEKEMQQLEKNLDDSQKAEQYSQLEERFRHLNGDAFSYRIKIILAGFGLEHLSLNQSLRFLSSGQKSKIALGAILLKGVDVLLLDEPTNNLDLPALIWLENFLSNSNAACLIVSHDKRFLDNVVSRVFELDWETRTLSVHVGGYTDYLEFKMKKINRLKELYRLQQEKIENLEKTIRSRKAWAAIGAKQEVSDKDKYCRGMRRDRAAKSAKNAKAMEKRIEKIDLIDLPKERSPLIIPLKPQESKAKHPIILKDVVVGYGNNFQIGPINLEIPYGVRVGILGTNGVGKTTLLKAITGELKIQKGEIKIGQSLVMGNLMQEHENLPFDKTIVQFLKERTNLKKEQIYQLLAKFNFSAEEAGKKIGELSPGGRARLILAFFCAISANVLVLDEPTNHLDIEASEALEEVLSAYSGTIILVSHDRYFVEKLNLTHLYVLKDGKLMPISSFDEYLAELTLSAKRLIQRLK